MPIVRFVLGWRSLWPTLAALFLALAAACVAVVTGAAPAGAVSFGPVRVAMELPASAVGASGPLVTEQLSAFSLSTTNQAGTARGVGAGRTVPVTSQASATFPIDTTSTELLQDVITGKVINPVDVVMYRAAAGREEILLTYKFRNVAISSYQLEDDAAGALVQVSFFYTAINVSYGVAAVKNGGVPAPSGWNLVTSKST